MGRFNVIDSNILDKQGILNLLRQFIFGNADISIYDQDRVYSRGDKAFIINPATGDIQVVISDKDNVTGPFDETKWKNITLSDTIGSGADKAVIISEYRPTDPVTKIWLTPDEFSTHYITIPGEKPEVEEPDEPITPDTTRGSIMLFHEEAIPMVEDTDTADLGHLSIGDLVFDIEGVSNVSVEGLTYINENDEIIIDEQRDVDVGDNTPTLEVSGIWVDTDLSDDTW